MKKPIKIKRHPDPHLDTEIDRIAHGMVAKMTPREIGLILYPSAKPIPLEQVPKDVIEDHLTRYTQEDLIAGQFLEVMKGKFTFIMDHETKGRKGN